MPSSPVTANARWMTERSGITTRNAFVRDNRSSMPNPGTVDVRDVGEVDDVCRFVGRGLGELTFDGFHVREVDLTVHVRDANRPGFAEVNGERLTHGVLPAGSSG